MVCPHLGIIRTIALPWLQPLLLALLGLLVHMLIAVETMTGIVISVPVQLDERFHEVCRKLWVLGDDALDGLADGRARSVELRSGQLLLMTQTEGICVEFRLTVLCNIGFAAVIS